MYRVIVICLMCCFIALGCPTTLRPYYCQVSGWGLVFENTFGKHSECGRNFNGSAFRGYGTVKNNNNFDVYVEIERTYYRNTSSVGSFTVEAKGQLSIMFTGGDAFRIKKSTGEPVGLVRANVLYTQDGVEKIYIRNR